MRFSSVCLLLVVVVAACSSASSNPPSPVTCGGATCSGATSACCESPDPSVAPFCAKGCDYLHYEEIACRGPANCNSGEVCCYAYNKGSGTYTQECTTTACNGYLQHPVP